MKKISYIKTMLLAGILLVGSGSIGAATATYTIATTSSVTTSGTAPSGSGATYSQTYTTTKGQITGSKSATLTLSGYAGNKITSIVLSMKSNTSSGAGSLNVVAGTTNISTATGAFNTSAWNGAWSTTYVNITKTPTAYSIKSGENVVITIAATANSLYIQSYSITYAAATSVPTLTTPTATSITTNTATLGATVSADGGATLTARGTAWGTSASPTGNAVAASGTATGAFTHARTGFTANTKYYYRGYATNSAGTAYSPDGTFTTLPNAPGVGAGSGATTNSLVANWTAPTGGSVAFTYEIQVDDNSDFSSLAFTQSSIASSSTSVTTTGLASATNYYYRVRANNATGSSAWSSTSAAYATLSAAVPTLTASAISNFGNICVNSVATNSFTITGATLTSAAITVHTEDPGFTLSATANGTYSTSLTFPQGGGAFSQVVYVKFIPTSTTEFNADIFIDGGGATGTLVSASGAGVNSAPTVDTPTSTAITATTAVLGGNISALGCTNATAKGIVWSITNGFADGTGTVVSSTGDFQTGIFTQAVTGLTPATTIYYKAFATNAGGTTYSSQSSFTTSAIAVPVATTATDISSNGFTANWNVVEGATEYKLNVFQRIDGGTQNVLSENFNNFTGGATGSGASSSDVSTSLDDYTQTAGWTGSKVYHAGGTVKFGTSNGLGYLVTPAINLSANSGSFNLAFEAMAWSGDATDFKIYLNDVLVYTATGLNNSTYSLSPYSVNLTGGTSSSKIKFEGKQASNGRFFLENIVITQASESITQISASPFTVTENNSKVISGLSASTTYKYTLTAKDVNAHETASSNEISVTTTAETTAATDYFRSKATGNWSAISTWESSHNGTDNWISATASPTSSSTAISIENGHEVSVANPATASSLVIKPTAKLTVNAGESLAATNLTIQSNAMGTGSFVNIGTATITSVTANQYLSVTRNWYVSSPVDGAVAPTGFTYYQRDETTASWTTQPFVAGNTFIQGKGYIALPVEAGSTLTFTGQLSTQNIEIDLSSSGITSSGFNLIGNPYPSHLSWTKEFTDANASLIEPTIYYRTNAGTINLSSQWSFPTYNAFSGESVPEGTSGNIPPMQAVWVRAITTGKLILDNKLTRSHQDSNPLKVRSSTSNSRKLRLLVSDGKSTDELLVYFNNNASNNYDAYDSPKMLNSDNSTVPDIYTTIGNKPIVINGMNSVPAEIPVYFKANASTAVQFGISATEISNFEEGTKVYLKNNKTGEQQLISNGTIYSFGPTSVGVDPSFSVIIRVPSEMTGFENNNNTTLKVYANEKGQITVFNSSVKENDFISVYNSLGQCLLNQSLKNTHTVLNQTFKSGIYVVKVNNISRKLIIE